MLFFITGCSSRQRQFNIETDVPETMTLIHGGWFYKQGQSGLESVYISDFYIDKTAVTVEQYYQLMGFPEQDIANKNPNAPITNINWYHAILYSNQKSKRDGLDTVYTYSGFKWDNHGNFFLADLKTNYTAFGYRLPLSHEFEYAARARTKTDFFWGYDTSLVCRYAVKMSCNEHNMETPASVATKKPNQWGLYDMIGNVWQFCNDSAAFEKDGQILTKRVIKGGSWNDDIKYFRSSASKYVDAKSINKFSSSIGFRTILPIFDKNEKNNTPWVIAGRDTSVFVGSNVTLQAKAFGASDSFRFYWDIGATGNFQKAPYGRVEFTPKGALFIRCIVKGVDAEGNFDLDSLIVGVYNIPAFVRTTGPITSTVNREVQITFSYSSQCSIENVFAWDIGNTGVFTITSSPDTTIIMPPSGNPTFTSIARITDRFGQSAYDTLIIDVQEHPPFVEARASRNAVWQNSSVSFTAEASDENGSVVSYAWDIGLTGNFVQTAGTDTTMITPNVATEQFKSVIRVTDNDNISSYDTVAIIIHSNTGPRGMALIPGDARQRISPFFIDTTEVTQKEFESLMGFNPSKVNDPSKPVYSVSWHEAAIFCNKRSIRDGFDTVYTYTIQSRNINRQTSVSRITAINTTANQNGYRLPSVRQWEHAYSPDKNQKFYWLQANDSLDIEVASKYAWFRNPSENAMEHPAAVATKKPNLWGLYDMAGNVAEWTQESKLKGGSFMWTIDMAARNASMRMAPGARINAGFRCVIPAESWKPKQR